MRLEYDDIINWLNGETEHIQDSLLHTPQSVKPIAYSRILKIARIKQLVTEVIRPELDMRLYHANSRCDHVYACEDCGMPLEITAAQTDSASVEDSPA